MADKKGAKGNLKILLLWFGLIWVSPEGLISGVEGKL